MMKFTLTQDDGTELDMTTHVQILYDMAIQSMDFGSGMLDSEEVGHLYDIADKAGFQRPCFACAYPTLQYTPEPTCDRFKRHGVHCFACSKQGSEESATRVKIGLKPYQHELMCPNKPKG